LFPQENSCILSLLLLGLGSASIIEVSLTLCKIVTRVCNGSKNGWKFENNVEQVDECDFEASDDEDFQQVSQ